jgi:formylglycine-generating enzyme required for sulfatase activity
VRYRYVAPFWAARCCVTNLEFEAYRPQFRRPLTSPRDRQPVTDITYLEALGYAAWLSERHGIAFTLPTEDQWTAACGASGRNEFPWGDQPDRRLALTRGPKVDGPLDVDDGTYGPNQFGLLHAVGNVQQMLLGTAYAPGTNGAAVDGMYCIVKGGDWRHCAFSVGVARRGIMDVAARVPTVGFRLVTLAD